VNLLTTRLFYIFLVINVYACSSVSKQQQVGVWIDVRTVKKYEESHIENTLNIPHASISETIASYVPDKSTKIYLYCREGRRAGMAKQSLTNMGYTNVVNLVCIADTRKVRKE